jgi:hypothetical protein
MLHPILLTCMFTPRNRDASEGRQTETSTSQSAHWPAGASHANPNFSEFKARRTGSSKKHERVSCRDKRVPARSVAHPKAKGH